jgi:hypothetical protein
LEGLALRKINSKLKLWSERARPPAAHLEIAIALQAGQNAKPCGRLEKNGNQKPQFLGLGLALAATTA